MTATPARVLCVAIFVFSISCSAYAQTSEGPMPPTPGATIQATPPEALKKLTARVTIVNAPVTVRDAEGAMIHNLDAQDFRVMDNGVPQKITHFEVGGDPISLVIVVETSSRIDPFVSEIRKTGILLAEQVMGPDAEAAVIGFDDSVNVLQGFTRSHDSIESAFASLKTGYSGMHLFDAMDAGVEMLTGRRKPTAETPIPGRRVLLILSESIDKGSAAHLGEILRRTQLENITIFSVGLSTTRSELQSRSRESAPAPITPPGISGMPPPPGVPPTPGAGQPEGIDLIALGQVLIEQTKSAATKHSLEIGAAATGGAYYSTYRGRSIQSAVDEIGAELHAQYFISYTPPRSDDGSDFGYHEISISLVPEKAQGKKISTRPGYYIPAPAWK
jgi:VWFA-related protein